MYYYFSIDKDIAIFTSRQYLSAPYVIGTPAVNRTQMAYYFCKIYDYPEFALRIKAKEFEDMRDEFCINNLDKNQVNQIMIDIKWLFRNYKDLEVLVLEDSEHKYTRFVL